MLLVTGGDPSELVISVCVVAGIVFVAWSEKTRLSPRFLPSMPLGLSLIILLLTIVSIFSALTQKLRHLLKISQ